MSEIDRELNWDDEIEKDNNFVTLPEGDYDFVIDRYERARHAGRDVYKRQMQTVSGSFRYGQLRGSP